MNKPKLIFDGEQHDVETHTINYHLNKVFTDSEQEKVSVIRNFRITAADGKSYDTKHYNLVQDRLFESDFDRVVKELGRQTKAEKP